MDEQPRLTLASYQSLASKKARDYDPAQDISARQMAILLDVCSRTGADMGRMLATGEQESAHTWNDYVRPPAEKKGSVGMATGVWQFQPATFASIVRLYGKKILQQSDADAAAGRPHMDLGAGPFDDAKVRSIIDETVSKTRRPGDEELQLLRHNFAVLAFAKHYLNVDSGAQTAEAEYLSHFLGAGNAQKILKLAASPTSRDLPCVRMPEESPPPDTPDMAASVPASVPVPVPPEAQLAADEQFVINNRGMFFRDGQKATQPFTWAEFMSHLADSVRASDNAALVRAKYGAGFRAIKGGDTEDRLAKPTDAQLAKEQWTFTADNGQRDVPLASSLVHGPLDAGEQEHYRARMAELVRTGDDKPKDNLTADENAWLIRSLKAQGVLAKDAAATDMHAPSVQDAMQAFARKVGLQEPKDPATQGQLTPALRVALEVYDQRVSKYADLQKRQDAGMRDAFNLNPVNLMNDEAHEDADPQVLALKEALHKQGLLNKPTEKVTEQVKVRVKKKVKMSKRTVTRERPFDNKVDTRTIDALNDFQRRNGLRPTDGVLDAETRRVLGLPEYSKPHPAPETVQLPDWNSLLMLSNQPQPVFNMRATPSAFAEGLPDLSRAPQPPFSVSEDSLPKHPAQDESWTSRVRKVLPKWLGAP